MKLPRCLCHTFQILNQSIFHEILNESCAIVGHSSLVFFKLLAISSNSVLEAGTMLAPLNICGKRRHNVTNQTKHF